MESKSNEVSSIQPSWSLRPNSDGPRGPETQPADPNATCFTSWLAGGGVEAGVIEVATDDVGYKAVEKPHCISDLQSTILQQPGLNYKKMDFILNGRPFHLVEEGTGPISNILT